MKKQDTLPTENSITRTPFPNSTKIYVDGKIHNIKVAMREITVSDTKLHNGKGSLPNPKVTVYDTSAPFTDPNIEIDVKKGLPRLREEWILKRGDVEQLSEITSDYGKERLLNSELTHLRFQHITKPYKAKTGMNVSQLHYAKKRNHHPRNGIYCNS